MKKITKFLVVALTVALLIGAVVGVSSSAADSGDEKWVISYNVSYDENIHLFFAVDASKATDSTLLKVDVLDAAGTSLIGEELLTVSEASKDIYKDGSVLAHIVKTPGVAAKDFADVFTINVYYGDAEKPVETTTYSVAEYFLQRLYKDGVVDATEGKAFSEKKLYEASLRYGAAAQKVLEPSDTTFVDDLIYITSPSITGVASKGYTIQLDSANYKFDYYSDTNKGVDYDMTGEAGYYVIDESVKITNESPDILTSSGVPTGAATFENLTASDTDLGPTSDSKYLGITGATDNTVGLTSIGGWSQKIDWHTLSIGQEDANNYLRLAVSEQTDSASHTADFLRDTTTDGNTLIFQVRMRTALASGGNVQVRVLRNRFESGNGSNASGYRHQFGTMSGNSDWFTLRVVMTNNPDGGVDYKYYKVADGKDLTTATPTKSGTIYATANNGTPIDTISDINAFCFMINQKGVGYIDFDYVYFNTVTINAVTLAPDYLAYDSSVWASDVIESGATFTDNNTTYTKGFATIRTENDNKYVSFADTTKSGQSQLRFSNSNDLTDKDTLTFKVDLRIRENPFGPNTYGGGDSSVQVRVRPTGSSGEGGNAGNLRIYVKNGKIALNDFNGGGTVTTDIDAGEWITVTVSYTSNAAKAQVTVTSGNKSATTEITGGGTTYQVDISKITDFGVYTSSGFQGIFDVDNVSIAASKAPVAEQ